MLIHWLFQNCKLRSIVHNINENTDQIQKLSIKIFFDGEHW